MYYQVLVNIFCFVLCNLISSCSSIKTSSQNETANALWHISNYALQSRQLLGNRWQQSNVHPATQYPYYPNYYMPSKYPTHPYAQPYPYRPYPQNPHSVQGNDYHHDPYYYLQAVKQHNYDATGPYYQNPNSIPSYKPAGLSVMDVLYSVARNDDLQCVPKIICEVTSDSISGRQSGLNLPVDVNMQSLIGFFSSLSGLQSSPLFHFGKAALLGYALKGNSRSCGASFPDCPADPDRLVQYLNNHNGGFFRFFGGLHPSPSQQGYPSLYHGHRQKSKAEKRIQNKPSSYISADNEITFPVRDFQTYTSFHHDGNGQKLVAEKRIQNRPSSFISAANSEQTNGIAFPPQDFKGIRSPKAFSFPAPKDHFSLYKSRSPFKFPEVAEENNPDQPFRKPKELPYDLSFYQSVGLDLQRPLPNHKASPMIFPDRTGTGELRLDLEDFDDSYDWNGRGY